MDLKQLIHSQFDDLSKSQKKVATHILDFPRQVALSSAQEMGEAIGVSETTVIRFCYSLEFSGYTELQKAIREQLLSPESSLSAYQQAKVKLQQQPHFFAQVMEQDRAAIAETAKGIEEADYDLAVERLSQARKVHVLGLRSSFAAANWLSYTLGLVRSEVQLIRPETEDVIQTLSEMDSGSVLIVISFHRYLKETVKIAELAKEQGCFVIGISDSQLAPIHAASDVLFPIYSPNKSTLDATASLFSFMNALAAGLVVKEKEAFGQRQEKYRALDSDYLFIEGAGKK